MFKWKEDYVIGVSEIDVQHKELFNIAARAYAVFQDAFRIDKYDEIVMILEELKEYAVYHFKSEEEYMEKVGYRKLFSHKVEHEDFIAKVTSVDLKKVDENQEKYLLDILNFIVEWTANHILRKDKEITSSL